MDLGITGRRAIVAAGTAGLGLGTAQALADEGVLVAVCGRNPDRLDAAVAALGPHAVGIIADLSEPDGAVRFAEEAEDRLGGTIDIVVANAGGPPPGTPMAASLDEYRYALELNTLATIALVQAVVPAMQHQRWGRVLAITSIGARQPIVTLAASSAARAATTSFIKNLATQVGPDNVTANTIQPGMHATDRVKALHQNPADNPTGGIPLGRFGDAADFGAVAAFLCSEPANFITGASIIVDGGASGGLQ
ncbi:MAG: SDR family oxidoreductase [Acidimicrobiales bacterium]